MLAGAWLFGVALVADQLDFAVVALVGDWLCRVSFARDWTDGVWIVGGSLLGTDWLGEAALVDDWLPCPVELAWFLCKALVGDRLALGRSFPDKS